MSSPEHKRKIWNMIRDIKIGMMTTEDDGVLRARPMTLVQDDYDGTLWFFTSVHAGKTDEISADHSVGITFADEEHDVYVSLSGTARVTKDRDMIDRFWNEYTAAWFPEGRDDPAVALLEVKIHQGEHWDVDDNRLVQLYEVSKARLTGKKPNLGEHERFN